MTFGKQTAGRAPPHTMSSSAYCRSNDDTLPVRAGTTCDVPTSGGLPARRADQRRDTVLMRGACFGSKVCVPSFSPAQKRREMSSDSLHHPGGNGVARQADDERPSRSSANTAGRPGRMAIPSSNSFPPRFATALQKWSMTDFPVPPVVIVTSAR